MCAWLVSGELVFLGLGAFWEIERAIRTDGDRVGLDGWMNGRMYVCISVPTYRLLLAWLARL